MNYDGLRLWLRGQEVQVRGGEINPGTISQRRVDQTNHCCCVAVWWKWHPVLQPTFCATRVAFWTFCGPRRTQAITLRLFYKEHVHGEAALPSAEQQNITDIQLFVWLTNPVRILNSSPEEQFLSSCIIS